jgi:hypothetical protein
VNLRLFIEQYDVANSIVLLEGKRLVLEDDKSRLMKLGKLLAQCTQNIIFRSGNAPGADLYFSEGVAAVDSKRLQVITPYHGHRKKYNVAGYTMALDQQSLMAESELIYASKNNPSNAKLVDDFVAGERNKNTIKAAYLIRDSAKVLGCGDWGPATVGLFYDDLANPLKGGTGHTMLLCKKNQIPVFDQKIWFDWLK